MLIARPAHPVLLCPTANFGKVAADLDVGQVGAADSVNGAGASVAWRDMDVLNTARLEEVQRNGVLSSPGANYEDPKGLRRGEV